MRYFVSRLRRVRFRPRPTVFLVSTLSLAFALSGHAGTHTQSFTLSPGWNAVYLEVTPHERDPADVFDGVPVEMVWAYFPPTGPTEFIADPDEGLWNVPGWHVFLPEKRDDAALTNLHAVIAPRAYLVKLGGDAPAVWEVAGTPAHRAPDWVPGGHTLAGLPVDPETTVNFGSFFHASPAHRNQPYHRLTPEGAWVRAHNSTLVNRGEAYWIHTAGFSAYHAPLEAEPGSGATLDFGESGVERTLRLTNHTDWTATVDLGVNDFPLLLAETSGGQTTWSEADEAKLEIPAGGERTLRLGLDRSALAGEARGVLRVAGADIVHWIALEAEEPEAGTGPQGIGPAGNAPHAGLWIGSVTVNAVSDVNDPDDPAEPRPTPAEFSKRIMVHVDAGGEARLLKEAILLWQDGEDDPVTGETVVPGRYVLLTDHDLIPNFRGSVLRDGRPFGHRVSAASFDFEGTELAMRGAFGDALLADIEVARDLPTNPFRHGFHPDHNHRDAENQPLGDTSVGREEVWPVYREVELVFDETESTGSSSGRPAAHGTYRETLTNLHRDPIRLRGTFELRRVNPIAELNPQP